MNADEDSCALSARHQPICVYPFFSAPLRLCGEIFLSVAARPGTMITVLGFTVSVSVCGFPAFAGMTFEGDFSIIAT